MAKPEVHEIKGALLFPTLEPPTMASMYDHKDAANHRKLRAHVQEVVDDLLAFNKLAVKMEAKAMRAVASTFSEDALTVWTS